MIEEIRIPEISENVKSGNVVSVLVKEGDMVDVDDVLIEFETEKAVVEIPSPVKGRITELFAQEGLEMKIGDVIARVDTAAQAEEVSKEKEPAEGLSQAEPPKAAAAEPAAAAAADVAEPQKPEKQPEEVVAAAGAEVGAEEQTPKPMKAEKERAAGRGPAPASPSVRRFARELGVDIYDVAAGHPGGRITEADIKAYVRKLRPSEVSTLATTAPSRPAGEPQLPDFSRWGQVEAVELAAVRRITAQSTSVSWQTVPHVTQFDEADISELQAFIQNNAAKLARQGAKLTLTAVLTKVCAEALKKFPRFNSSIDLTNGRLIFKKSVHIGLAVDTPRGLLVPVIREADTKSITELAILIADLAERSRNKKIKPDEMEGGSFTISNQGGIGGVAFTPIVLWPQAAILGVSRASIEPKYIDGQFKPRSILPLALSYDHRILDGADAARFLRWVCESLASPFTMFLD
jgi:pyruvate dehydrogenase E2 component (dihydrolipoyllysine-residue acetyltransferase)